MNSSAAVASLVDACRLATDNLRSALLSNSTTSHKSEVDLDALEGAVTDAELSLANELGIANLVSSTAVPTAMAPNGEIAGIIVRSVLPQIAQTLERDVLFGEGGSNESPVAQMLATLGSKRGRDGVSTSANTNGLATTSTSAPAAAVVLPSASMFDDDVPAEEERGRRGGGARVEAAPHKQAVVPPTELTASLRTPTSVEKDVFLPSGGGFTGYRYGVSMVQPIPFASTTVELKKKTPEPLPAQSTGGRINAGPRPHGGGRPGRGGGRRMGGGMRR